jgi:hypothetical protein
MLFIYLFKYYMQGKANLLAFKSLYIQDRKAIVIINFLLNAEKLFLNQFSREPFFSRNFFY